MLKSRVPVLGFAAYSGTGKTTLLVKLIPLLKDAGIRVALIKHAHHDFDIDIPGKDSYELRKVGANQVLVASARRRALIREMATEAEPQLEELVSELDLKEVDLVLVEGFRHVAFPKIELHRPSLNRDLIFVDDPDVIAVASDQAIDTSRLPLLDINQPEEIVRFIEDWINSLAIKDL
ncbi:MAG: molybdopterin-guanine dinucleotide biosynthesis protein MobB [Gammaproteobacteria bacterium]|jgi:molybdopterin-guanine dinucleotide biosynthesis protein MobB